MMPIYWFFIWPTDAHTSTHTHTHTHCINCNSHCSCTWRRATGLSCMQLIDHTPPLLLVVAILMWLGWGGESARPTLQPRCRTCTSVCRRVRRTGCDPWVPGGLLTSSWLPLLGCCYSLDSNGSSLERHCHFTTDSCLCNYLACNLRSNRANLLVMHITTRNPFITLLY